MTSAMEFLDEQEDDKEMFELMEELVDEESINEIEKKKSVKVQDVDVFIRPQEINTYYGTTPHNDLSKGILKNTIFRLYDPELAAALQREIDNIDVWEADTHLRQSELERDLALWSIFMSHSLKPTQQRTNTVLEIAQFLYCIKFQLQVDIDQLIHIAIVRAGKMVKSIIPFPCLISDLFIQEGVFQ
ncbi:hypothetical protein LWI28_027041 [Acer negundo]|uniref:Putative plant transposon protein domain-containing protein n=1 Tax=Acer negundo TaxID=4023 RepID=A0AAD5IKT0_ACENE|nr:hypothetical protein LWI28_027041 [Acer negundo]